MATDFQLKSSLCVELHRFLAERREVRKLYISYEMLKYELVCWDSCSKAQKSPFNLLHCIFLSLSFYLSLSTRMFAFFFFFSWAMLIAQHCSYMNWRHMGDLRSKIIHPLWEMWIIIRSIISDYISDFQIKHMIKNSLLF